MILDVHYMKLIFNLLNYLIKTCINVKRVPINNMFRKANIYVTQFKSKTGELQ